LKSGRAEKIILCRPVVDVGNSIGYLPGDMEAKIGPYLTPLFDELAHYVELKHINRLMEEGRIEICPLSMMRGRTFNNCFVILDEAQNATNGELKMFLTRIGIDTKMVLVGDLNQSDLPPRLQGGFRRCVRQLDDLESIAVVELENDDIVRHRLISDIQARLEET
jgi:phosphate starvation-inducible PhoH-like protein